jgi:hypothetical protein
MRRRRFQKGSLQLRKHADRRVWVVLYYDEKANGAITHSAGPQK